MKKILREAYAEAKTLPKGLWVTAVFIPFGIATLTVYIASKSAYTSFKKKDSKNK